MGMSMNSIDDLFAYRDKVDRYIEKKIGTREEEERLYLNRWEEIAPQLLDIGSCVYEWATVKIKFGINKNLEIVFNGVPGGGCRLKLNATHALYMYQDRIQFIESDPLYHQKTELIYCEETGVCDIGFMFDRKVSMMRYILNNWTELKPLILKSIAGNLKVWAENL